MFPVRNWYQREICALMGYYAAYSGNSLPTFRDNQSVPSEVSRKPNFLTLGDGSDKFPEMSVRNYHCTLRNIPEDSRSHPLRGGSLISRTVPLRCALKQVVPYTATWYYSLTQSLRDDAGTSSAPPRQTSHSIHHTAPNPMLHNVSS